jgi:outer membrane murein-binding lipoprotein Lpp
LNVTPVTTLAQDVEAETEDDLSDAVQDLSDEIATLSNEIDELSVQVDSLDDDDEDDEDDDGDAVQNAGISVVSNDNDEVVAGVSVDATESTESTESTVSSDPSQNSNSDGISSSDLPDGMMVTADGEIVPMNTVLENENGNTIVLDTTGVTLNADPCNTILNDTGNMTAD